MLLGKGRIVWFNTDFEGSATNLPLLGVFAPLMSQLGQAVRNTDQTSNYNFLIGDTVSFQPEASDGTDPFAILRPDGTLDYGTPDTNF